MQFLQTIFDRKISHQCLRHSINYLDLLLAIVGNHTAQLVAVIKYPFAVGHNYAITVAIKRYADIGPMMPYSLLHCSAVSSAAFIVDIETVWLCSNGNNICSQLMQHRSSNLIRGAMSTINDNTKTSQIKMIRKSAFAKLDVASSSVIDPPRFP